MPVSVRRVRLSFSVATEADAAAIAGLRVSAGEQLTATFGHGHWSGGATERGVLASIRASRVLVAHRGGRLVGTLLLQTKKPWAIDTSYFTPGRRPLYLLNMAVAPAVQRMGVGRALLEQAAAVAREWPGDAIRLDAYDAAAGAGGFYASCGYREVGRVTYRTVPLIYYERLL
jgi:ribosomal protein S18 acetylase RimI-like enzyme